MHRLIQLSGTSLLKNSHTSLNSFIKSFDPSVKTCSLCKQSYLVNAQTRSQSTNVYPNVKLKKLRKRKKSKKDYTELVVVTNNSSCQTKAKVQKLTFSDLKLLASTNLNLSELHKLKDLSRQVSVEEHTYNNLNIIEDIPRINDESINDSLKTDKADGKAILFEIPDLIENKDSGKGMQNDFSAGLQQDADKVNDHIGAVELESEMDIESLRRVSTFQPEVIEDPLPEAEEPKENHPEKNSKPTLDYHRREEIASKTLAAYIEVCNHMKSPLRGLGALNFHRFKTKKIENKTFVPIKSINAYNALLKGFAIKGDLIKLKEILKIMQEEQITPNVQSYIAIFSCLGNLPPRNSQLEDITSYTHQALADNITYDKIMNEGSLLNHDRDSVLKAMRIHDPSYVPVYKKPEVRYQNHLVDHLNNDEQLKCAQEDSVTVGGAVRKLVKGVRSQIETEQEGYVTIKSINDVGTITEEVTRYREALQDHYRLWEEAAMEAFQRDLSALSAQRNANNMEPYMRCIPAKDFVAIIIDEAKKIAHGSETYSPTVNMLYRDLGSKVYARYRILCKHKTGVLDKIRNIHSAYCATYVANRRTPGAVPTEEVLVNPRQAWQWIEYEKLPEGATLSMDHQPWMPTTLQFVGKFLYHIVMYDLKVNVNAMRGNHKHINYLPAFYTVFRTQGRLVKEEVKPHPILSKLYRSSLPETLTFPAHEVPMLCPPVPWISADTGGYLVAPCDVVRLPSQVSAQRQSMDEVGAQQLYPSLDSLNQLASVPWKVNKRILDTVLQVFNSGGSSSLDVPEPPSSLEAPVQVTEEMDKAERYRLFRQRMQLKRKKAEMYSLWCDCLYRLSLANHFRDDTFWLPHNMDFRGRVYPVPPHLNHLGSDLARSMLVFAESRPLGKDGLDWLKIHLINLTGLKKRDPISERLKYANENMDVILDSADNPLTGYRWWSKSDEPWQTLACCMEIADVVRSPDPENYRSHFPIHQDGSCNGLQHYAALGRDSGGAYSVNLAPSVVPQDVYSAVVALVEEQRAKDAENGHEIAKALEGFVVRKVIKQTVMTTVYGVTRFGARLQIARQLKDIDKFPKDSVWAASSYLTGRTFDSLRTMFTSTREIQDWFTECARLISAVGGRNVEWVTPLGLPVVQPYVKYRKPTSGIGFETFGSDKYEKPNVLKQKNAFPPNFIHSLDSNHMMLTSLHCERAGITFVSVHDCYWTHPSTVEIMNKICREQFVALHSQPILEDLSAFMCDKYGYSQCDFTGDGSFVEATKKKLNRVLRQLPKTGSFDIKKVLDSIYFFS